MWVGYLKHRQQLGFNYLKNINSIEQLLDFTSNLKNSFTLYNSKR